MAHSSILTSGNVCPVGKPPATEHIATGSSSSSTPTLSTNMGDTHIDAGIVPIWRHASSMERVNSRTLSSESVIDRVVWSISVTNLRMVSPVRMAGMRSLAVFMMAATSSAVICLTKQGITVGL